MQDARKRALGCSVLAVAVSALGAFAQSAPPNQTAITPPMGWNSYDGYGTTINEAAFKANADWFAAHLKPFGWQYVVIDEEWYVTDPVQDNSKNLHYTMDRFGRYTPALNRFPSAAGDAGFTPLADYVHSLGLKFGIHILRGIPQRAMKENLPIAGSPYHAAEAANLSDTCPWNYDNYGVDASKPAGQAYYDSIARLYADWGVDFVKADCISSNPYRGDEIRTLRTALNKTGRPIVLSLSPGPSPLEKIDELRKYSQMWRISNDIWDLWHGDRPYPQGVRDQFANAALWAPFTQPGGWPDADMLPVGRLGPAPGWGKPRDTRLTRDEQRTLLTLWSIFRSPLMIGGDLPAADKWTVSLLTNREVLAVNQHSTGSHPVISTAKTVLWLSEPASGDGYYLDAFNVADSQEKTHYTWSELGLRSKEYRIRDLWKGQDLGAASMVDLLLPAHGCALYRLSLP